MTIAASNLKTQGIVFEIQRFSVHDGPGIRTIVFFKGCPLSCQWCSNPESQTARPQLTYIASNCIHCGQCLKVCPAGALNFRNSFPIDYGSCIACGNCVAVCYSGALNLVGTSMTVETVIGELRKDSNYYRRSGGGITLSGGEPLAQPEFAEALLRECKKNGWHTAVETAAHVQEKVLNAVLPWLNLVLLDIKHMDNDKHRTYTGRENGLIHKNARLIAASQVPMVIRVPVIPRFNDSVEEIRAIADFARSLETVKEVHLLPYHRLGQNKYDYLGRPYQLEGITGTRHNSLLHLKEAVEKLGLSCKIGGND